MEEQAEYKTKNDLTNVDSITKENAKALMIELFTNCAADRIDDMIVGNPCRHNKSYDKYNVKLSDITNRFDRMFNEDANNRNTMYDWRNERAQSKSCEFEFDGKPPIVFCEFKELIHLYHSKSIIKERVILPDVTIYDISTFVNMCKSECEAMKLKWISNMPNGGSQYVFRTEFNFYTVQFGTLCFELTQEEGQELLRIIEFELDKQDMLMLMKRVLESKPKKTE